jgi:hypothetical protein
MYGNPLNTRANLSGDLSTAGTGSNWWLNSGIGLATSLGSGLFGLFQSNNQVDIANANLEATKLQQQALIKQYELQYQTKLTDSQKQELLNEQAKQQADAEQKKTQTYILGGIGAMVVAGILYAILKK